MVLFLSGILSVLTTVLSIRWLGLVTVKNKNVWLKTIIIEIITTGLAVLLGNINEVLISFSILFLIIPLIVIFKMERNSLSRICSSVIIVIAIIFLLDMLIYPLVMYFFESIGMSNLFIEKSIIPRTISDLFILIASIIICKIINKISSKVKLFLKENNIKISSSAMIIFVVLVIVTILLMKYTLGNEEVNKSLMVLSILIGLTYLSLIVLIIFLIYKGLKKTLENKEKQREVNDIVEYASRLEDINKGMRKFRYDYINILSNLLGYIENNEINKLEKVLKNKITDLTSEINKKNSSLELLYNIKNKQIKTIMISKVLMAQELGIDVIIEIPEEIENVNMDMLDFCNCLRIILDFAIEKSRDADKSEIRIGFIKKENETIILIVSFIADNIPPIHKVFEDGLIEDGQVGLSSLRDITLKYPKAFLDTKIEGGVFSQILELD